MERANVFSSMNETEQQFENFSGFDLINNFFNRNANGLAFFTAIQNRETLLTLRLLDSTEGK